MKTPNRDLLVLVKDEYRSQESMENEVDQLNRLLISYETMDNFCQAHEIFDLNRFKIISSTTMIRRMCREKVTKPFVFYCNKN